jgi:hypothetical protein
MLDGMFSFILLDDSVSPSRMVVARDPIGITTLYTGWNSSKPSTRWFASELKSLQEECDVIQAFPPGHVYDSNTGETVRYFEPKWWDGDSGKPEDIPHGEVDLDLLRASLEKAVRKRLMSEVPFGVLLSGGLDSSLVASIAAREMQKISKEQQAILEERQKKIQAGANGAQTPVGLSDPMCMFELFEQFYSSSHTQTRSPLFRSRTRRKPSQLVRRCPSLLRYRSRRVSRFVGCTKGCQLLGNETCRVRVHYFRGLGCSARGESLSDANTLERLGC